MVPMGYLAFAIRLGLFLPSCARGLSSNLGTLFLGHGLEPSLPADLTTLAAYCSHILREIDGRGRNCGWLWFGRLARRLIYNPLRKLVRITRTFAFANHRTMMPQAGILRRDCGYSN